MSKEKGAGEEGKGIDGGQSPGLVRNTWVPDPDNTYVFMPQSLLLKLLICKIKKFPWMLSVNFRVETSGSSLIDFLNDEVIDIDKMYKDPLLLSYHKLTFMRILYSK